MTEPAIRSVHNPRLRAAARLRDRRDRDAARRFLVDGVREIGRALDGGLRVVEAFVEPEAARATPERSALVDRLVAGGAEIVTVGPEALGRVAFGQRSEGTVAVVETPDRSLASLDAAASLPAEPLVAVLEAIEKPGNVGAILRTADGAGVDAVILADPVADPWNPNTIRASLGTVFTSRLAVAGSAEARAWLRERDIRIVATRVDAERSYEAADLRRAVALVLGSEAHGLTATWAGPDVEAVRLPMLGRADSLNVAATAAVLFYEARRQRG